MRRRHAVLRIPRRTTAPERRIGSFLTGKPSAEWVLSTKVGRRLELSDNHTSDHNAETGFVGDTFTRRVFDFSRDGIRRSFDASLARLGLDHADILFLHDPDDH